MSATAVANEFSVAQTRHTRKPFMPSSIFNRLQIVAIVSRAAFSSMQGTKKE